jgi:hypothetical protein
MGYETFGGRPAGRLVIWLLGGAGALLAATATAQAPADGEASVQAFRRMTEVLRHPRCMNCHPSGDVPRQADDRHRHRMLVARGPDDRGTPTLKCSTCHQTANTADGRVPGAPHWQLAPRSMGWEGLSDGDLCRVLKDPAKNRGRSVQALVDPHDGGPARAMGVEPGRAHASGDRPARVPRARAAVGPDGCGVSVLAIERGCTFPLLAAVGCVNRALLRREAPCHRGGCARRLS